MVFTNNKYHMILGYVVYLPIILSLLFFIRQKNALYPSVNKIR